MSTKERLLRSVPIGGLRRLAKEYGIQLKKKGKFDRYIYDRSAKTKEKIMREILKHRKPSRKEILEFKERYPKEREARRMRRMKVKCLKCRAPIESEPIKVIARGEDGWEANLSLLKYTSKDVKSIAIYHCDRCGHTSAYPVLQK